MKWTMISGIPHLNSEFVTFRIVHDERKDYAAGVLQAFTSRGWTECKTHCYLMGKFSYFPDETGKVCQWTGGKEDGRQYAYLQLREYAEGLANLPLRNADLGQ